VRSERLFCEQLDYNLLFRRFLEMDVAAPSFDHSSFSRNRARLLAHDRGASFSPEWSRRSAACNCFRTET
jgi:transposase